MRLGLDETGVTELLGVVDHCRGLNKVAFALLLEEDQGTVAPLLPYPPEEAIGERVAELLRGIAAREERRLGRPGIPAIWRALSRNRHYLEATWKKHELLFDRPGIEATGKLAVGLGVSVTNGCRYFIRYFTTALCHAGWDADKVLEVIGVVDHYNSLNTIASGMQIVSDIRPEGAT